VLLLCFVFRIAGCTYTSLLEGHYHLVSNGPCDMGEIRSDRLILHDDGTFEQHTISKSVIHYDSLNEKWKYVGHKSIRLDSWNDFSGASADFKGIKKSVVLRVEPAHPQIVFAPSGCYYAQPK
jgi:hypothetical protein